MLYIKIRYIATAAFFHDFSDYKFVLLSAEEMLRTQDYFKNGQLDKNGLVKFIKDVKKNTKLSDEDAAVLAASKIVDLKPHSRMWYRIGAVRIMTGGRKTQPATKMSDKLKEVSYNSFLFFLSCPFFLQKQQQSMTSSE